MVVRGAPGTGAPPTPNLASPAQPAQGQTFAEPPGVHGASMTEWPGEGELRSCAVSSCVLKVVTAT